MPDLIANCKGNGKSKPITIPRTTANKQDFDAMAVLCSYYFERFEETHEPKEHNFHKRCKEYGTERVCFVRDKQRPMCPVCQRKKPFYNSSNRTLMTGPLCGFGTTIRGTGNDT